MDTQLLADTGKQIPSRTTEGSGLDEGKEPTLTRKEVISVTTHAILYGFILGLVLFFISAVTLLNQSSQSSALIGAQYLTYFVGYSADVLAFVLLIIAYSNRVRRVCPDAA